MTIDEAGEPTRRPQRSGLAGYFAGKPANVVLIYSKGKVGYLPRENLRAALQIDRDLKVLDEP